MKCLYDRSTSRAARLDRSAPEPRIGLSPPYRDGLEIEARRQHFDDRFDLEHGYGQPAGFGLVVIELAGQLGMELGEGE